MPKDRFYGRVKAVVEGRGFAFIKPDDGSTDLFVHLTDVRTGTLAVGDDVEYDVAVDRRHAGKLRAVAVRVVAPTTLGLEG